MRSSASYSVPPRPLKKKKEEGYVLGPVIYNDTTDEADTDRTANRSFTDHSSPVPEVDSLNFRSPMPTTVSSSRSSKKSKKSVSFASTSSRSAKPAKGSAKKSTKSSLSSLSQSKYCKLNKAPPKTPKRASKKEKKPPRESEESSEEAAQQERDADLQREKSSYEKRKRDKIIELGKRADQDLEKLMLQRTRAQQAAKEIEQSLAMEQGVRSRSMAKMKNQVEGLGWRSNRDLRDVRKELDEWKEKTAQSGQLATRVDTVEQRVTVLEKAEVERKKTANMVDQNWADFGRLKTQSMALEVTQIKNRRGAAHLARMPKAVAETTSKNLYKLCADLQRMSMLINSRDPLSNLVEEAFTLAEAIAPLYGPKEEFIDSRENTSSTNVSLSNVSLATRSDASKGSSANSSPSGSTATSPTKKLAAPVRSSLRRNGKNPVAVSIPPLSKFVPNYSLREKLFIDAPSLREKSSNYYSDKEFISLSKESANCEPTPVVPQAEQPQAPATPGPAPSLLTPAAPVVVQVPAPVAAAPAAPAAEAAAPSPAPELPAAAAVAAPVEAPLEAPAAAAAGAAGAAELPPSTEAPPEATAPAVAAVAAAAAAPVPVPEAAPSSVSISIDSDRDPLKELKKKKGSRRSLKESKGETQLE